jgi:hypothetical protein
MARNSDPLPNFDAENTGGLLSGLLAEEEEFDRRAMWRLGSWGVGTVAAVVVAVLVNQSALRSRMDLAASDDLARQAQQLRTVARESQNEAKRLASAVETLNSDRDRLYSRVAVLEQNLDSVTGSIAKQNAVVAAPQAAPAPTPTAPAEPQTAAQSPAPAAPTPAPAPPVAAAAPPAATAPAPVVAPVATIAPAVTTALAATTEKPRADTAPAQTAPTTVASVAPANPPPAPAAAPAPLVPAKSMMAPPDAAATKLIEPEKSASPDKPASAITAAPIPEVTASIPLVTDAEADPLAVQRTQFAVDVGTASSISGLRALWRGLLKSNSTLAALRPVIAVKEVRNGFGMQLRLLAGPLGDAATAAKICAALVEGQRPCETTVFDGQRLAMQGDEKLNAAAPPPVRPASVRPFRKRSNAKPVASADPPPKPEGWTLSSLLNRR